MLNKLKNLFKKKVAGITLIELVIAMALATLVAATIVFILGTGFNIFKSGTNRFSGFKTEQTLIDKIAKETENASRIYGAEGDRIAFWKFGYTLTDHPAPVGEGYKKYDIVVYGYTKANSICKNTSNLNNGCVYREVWNGLTPSVTSKPYGVKQIMTDKEVDITRFKISYYNYMGYWDYEKLPFRAYIAGVVPGPYTRFVPANITPSDYPQNVWKNISWSEGTTAGNPPPLPGAAGENAQFQTRFLQESANLTEGNYKLWWDDGFPAGAAMGGVSPGPFGWATIPDTLPFSGDSSYYLTADLNPNDKAEKYFTGAAVLGAAAVPGDDLLYYNSQVPASFNLAKQPNLDTDTPDGTQLEVTLGVNLAGYAATCVGCDVSPATGDVIINGTDPINAAISETLSFAGPGETQITFARFKTVTGITTVNLNDENPKPSITITNPNKKVWAFTNVFLDPNPVAPVKMVMLNFYNSTDGVWGKAYWTAFRDKGKINTWLCGDNTTYCAMSGRLGDNLTYMGPLPPQGKWVTLSVPMAASGIRAEGRNITGEGFVVYGAQSAAYFDRATIGMWSKWTGEGGADAFYTGDVAPDDVNPSVIKNTANSNNFQAHYIQYRTTMETAGTNTGPIISDAAVEFGASGSKWVSTTDDDWRKGAFDNTVPRSGDIELFRLSGTDNIVQGEEGPIPLVPAVEGVSYATGIWTKLKWGRDYWVWPLLSCSGGGQWQNRKRILVQENDGVMRIREPIQVTVTTTVGGVQDTSIRVTTQSGVEKPYQWLSTLGFNHTIVFFASVPAGGTTSYYVYYNNASAGWGGGCGTPPYTQGGSPGYALGNGIRGYYFDYNVWYKNAVDWHFFPAAASGQGRYRGNRIDSKISFNWGNSNPGFGLGNNYFSVGWNGYVYIPATGAWNFFSAHDDGLIVDFDGANIHNEDAFNGAMHASGGAAKNKGVYPLNVKYREYSGGANVQLQYSGPTFAQADIPQNNLYAVYDSTYKVSYNWNGIQGTLAPGAITYVQGPQQNRTDPDMTGTIQFKARGTDFNDTNPAANWTDPGWAGGFIATDPPDVGSVEKALTIDKRYLQVRSYLTGSATDTPLLGEFLVCNGAIHGTCPNASDWVYQTNENDWEAGTPGTTFDAGDPEVTNQSKPNVSNRAKIGAIILASSAGNETQATPQNATANISMNTYDSQVWDKLHWTIGNMFWHGNNRFYMKEYYVANNTNIPRFNEPVTVNLGNLSGKLQADCRDLLLTTPTGVIVPYEFVGGCNAANVNIRMVATIPAQASITYTAYYGDATLPAGALVFCKTMGVGCTVNPAVAKWENGKGLIGDWYGNAATWGGWWRADGFRGQTIVSQISGNQSNFGVGQYFSVAYNGWVYMDSTTTYNFRLSHMHGLYFQIDDGNGVWSWVHNHMGNFITVDELAPIWRNRGFHRVYLQYEDYTGGSNLTVKGVGINGAESQWTVVPSTEWYTTYNGVYAGPGDMTSSLGPERTKSSDPLYMEPFGTVTVQTRGSSTNVWGDPNVVWTGSYGPHGAGVQTAEYNIIDGSRVFRFLQTQVTLNAAAGNSKTPVLSELWVLRKPDAKWFMHGGLSGTPWYDNWGWTGSVPNRPYQVEWPSVDRLQLQVNPSPTNLAGPDGDLGNPWMFTLCPSTYGNACIYKTLGGASWTKINDAATDWPSGGYIAWQSVNQPFRRAVNLQDTMNLRRIREPQEIWLDTGNPWYNNANDASTRTYDVAGTWLPHWNLGDNFGVPNGNSGTSHKILALATAGPNAVANGSPYYVYYGDMALADVNSVYNKSNWDTQYGGSGGGPDVDNDNNLGPGAAYTDFTGTVLGSGYSGRWTEADATPPAGLTTYPRDVYGNDSPSNPWGQTDNYGDAWSFWVYVPKPAVDGAAEGAPNEPSSNVALYRRYHIRHDDQGQVWKDTGVIYESNTDPSPSPGTVNAPDPPVHYFYPPAVDLQYGFRKMKVSHMELGGGSVLDFCEYCYWQDMDVTTNTNWVYNRPKGANSSTIGGGYDVYGYAEGAAANNVTQLVNSPSDEQGKKNWDIQEMFASRISINFSNFRLNAYDRVKIWNKDNGALLAVYGAAGDGTCGAPCVQQAWGANFWTGWLAYNANRLKITYGWKNSPGNGGIVIAQYAYVPAYTLAMYQGANEPAYSIDNNLGTRSDTCCYDDASQNWMVVDLGPTAGGFTIAKWELWYLWDGIRYNQFIVEASEDGSTWYKVESPTTTNCNNGSCVNNTNPATAAGYYSVFSAFPRVRYMRIRTTYNSNLAGLNKNINIVEFKVYKALYYNPGNLVKTQPFEQNTPWVEDGMPAGAVAGGEAWSWGVVGGVNAYSGASYHTSPVTAGIHQHYFSGATTPIFVPYGGVFMQWVYLDSTQMPTTLMLQFHATDATAWEHRAYWGPDTIPWGASGCVSVGGSGSHCNQGLALPKPNQWQLLVVKASEIGMEGLYIDGWAYALNNGGNVRWDASSLGDMTIDAKYLRVAAGNVQVHFNKLLLRGNDRLQVLDDSTGQVLYSLSPSQNGTPPPNSGGAPSYLSQLTTITGLAGWTNWLGSADLRFQLIYNYTDQNTAGFSGYSIDQYNYYFGASASRSDGGTDPFDILDNGDVPAQGGSNKTYWQCDITQPEGCWIIVDMGRVFSINKIINVLSPTVNYTYKYRLETSLDFETWDTPNNCIPYSCDMTTNTVGTTTVGATGFTHKFARRDAQYIRVTFNNVSGPSNNVLFEEMKVFVTPYLTPGTHDSQVLAPRRDPAGGNIIKGDWNRTLLTDANDWSFNNEGWLGNWADGGGGAYSGMDYTGTAGSLSSGGWDGLWHIRHNAAGNYWLYSSYPQNFEAGMPDATQSPDTDFDGVPDTKDDYSTARYIQANFLTNIAGTAQIAFLTKNGYGGAETWKYTNATAVAANTHLSLVWDMLDATQVGTDWPWLIIANTQPAAGIVTLTANQPPYDENLANGDTTPVLQVIVSGGAQGSGTVTINGVDATGAGISEQVKFFENSTMNTKKKFARVDSITTTGLSDEGVVPTIKVQCLAFSGTIKRVAFAPITNFAVWRANIDNIRVLPHTSEEKVTDFNNAIPTANGSAFINPHFDKFTLRGDDIVQFWGKSTGGIYSVFLAQYDKNSFPAAGGWAGNLGWGYDDVKIRFIYNPNGDNASGNPAWRIDKFLRSHRFYASSIYNNDNPGYGAWRGGDPDQTTYWKSKGLNALAPNNVSNPNNPTPNSCWDPVPGSCNYREGWYVDLWADDIVPRQDYDLLTVGSQAPTMNKVCLMWNNDPQDYLVATSDDAANWTEVSVVTVRGQCLIFGSVMARYIAVFPLIDDVTLLDRTVELLDFQVYLAGPYVNYGTYTSMPYQASSNQIWQVPYPRDSYDIRIHFTHFNTQGSTNGYPYHDLLRMYDETTGMLYKRLYGSYGAGGGSSLGADSLIPDTTPGNQILGTGFRTNWLFCESAIAGCNATGSVPSTIDITKLGTRIKLMWEGPLAYDPAVTGWIVDGYELYTKINPTMIQVDVGAARGAGRNKRETHLSTKIQPPNLLLKGSN